MTHIEDCSVTNEINTYSVASHVLGQVKDGYQFPSQALSFLESFREHDDFSNEFIIRSGHGHRTEELL